MRKLIAKEDITYLRPPKTKNENESLVEPLDDKYPDTKKPFPSYEAAINFLAGRESTPKQAGGLMDRVQKQQEGTQQLSGLLSGALDKFRSLVFEVRGTEQVIEVAKSGTGLDMKVFSDKESPTPVTEKKFSTSDFLSFFLKRLAPQNAQEVATELSSKGVAEINKGTFASVTASLRKADETTHPLADTLDNDTGVAEESDAPAYLVSKTYEVVTPESAENGEPSDQGFEFKDETMSLQDLAHEIESEGFSEWSNSDGTGWLYTTTPVQDRAFFEKGEEKTYSLHFKKLDGSELDSEDYATIRNLTRR